MLNLPYTIRLALLLSPLLIAQPACAATPNELPPDSEYVQVIDGQLHMNGQRVRFWGTNGHTFAQAGVTAKDSPAEARARVTRMRRSNQMILDRLEALGMNSVRVWIGFPRDGGPYTKGDGSLADSFDYFLSEAHKRGFRVWYAGWNSIHRITTEDVGVIDDPETAEAWVEGIRAASRYNDDGTLRRGWDIRNNVARIWDPRLEAFGIAAMTRTANHVNQYTGLRYADDPVFGVWELANEEWWMRKMVGGQWQRLPDFFRKQLIAKWQDFLLEKYQDTDGLKQAWGGLLAGESLERGTVLLAPMARPTKGTISIGDQNPFAREALEALEQPYGREDFEPARGADVLEFFMDLQLAHKKRTQAALEPLGKSTRLAPVIYDTGIGYEIQSQYMHQNADAVSHNAYVNGFGPPIEGEMAKARNAFNDFEKLRLTLDAERISANEGPWVNWLTKPPAISQGVPWLEHNRVEGMPYLVYETNIMQPAKYRADFPLRLLALASIQDWDWLCWHYFGDGSLNKLAENPNHFSNTKMDLTTGRHPQGYHYTYDEVMSAMVRAAGMQFRNFAYQPAPNPTPFIYGRNALYDPASMDYGHSYGRMGLDMLQTTYQHGVRIRIDPTREDNEVVGPVVSFDDRHTHNPYTPTDAIAFDWKKGIMTLDSPSAVAFTGFLGSVGGSYQFDHGVKLTDVELHTPEGTFDPLDPESKYVAFSLYSHDNQPLDQAQKISLSLVGTSYNSGMTLKDNGRAQNAGKLPVRVTRVTGTVHAPALDGMRVRMLDWNLKTLGVGRVTGGKFTLPNKPVFVVEFERDTKAQANP